MTQTSSPEGQATFDVQALIALKRVAAAVPAPCGTWAAVALERLIHDGSKYACDLWRVPLDGSGGALQLTRGKSRDTAPCFRSDGALGFLSNRIDSDGEVDADAEKRKQVWILPAAGGEPQPLTDEPLGVDAFKFAAQGDCLAVLAPVLPNVMHNEQRKTAAEREKKGPSALRYKSMPVRFWDHWLSEAAPHLIAYDASGGKRCDLTPDADRQHREASFDIASDGARIAITHATPGADRVDDVALLVIEVAGGARSLLGAESCTALNNPLFSPDGMTIACSHEPRPAHRCTNISLRLLDLTSGQAAPLAADWDRWPTPAGWSADGKTLIVTAEDAACTPVFGVDVASGQVSRLTTGGTHSSVQVANGGALVGLRSGLRHPPELFCMPSDGDGLLRLPARLSGFDSDCAAASIENFDTISTDGHVVQAYLLKPAQHRVEDGPLPTLIWVHGGPISAWGDVWHWRWCPLTAVAQGYAVVLPNPRGSTGFGQAYVDGIWGNVWGKQCFEDVMAVTAQAAARADVDAGRMAAMGGSFGGYMTNWIGSQTDRFKCLVTHASVYSMAAFTGVTDLPAFWMLEMDGSPYDDAHAFDRYSPSRFVANWKSPALIIHGDLDYRVPVGESLALFEALQYHGVESELMIFPDENHWILKPNNSIAWYQAVFEFLARHLKAK